MLSSLKEPYCDKCKYFKAVTESHYSRDTGRVTYVSCENRAICKELYNHIKKEVEKNVKN